MTISKLKADKNQVDAINQLIYQSKLHWGYDEYFLNSYIETMGISTNYLEKESAYLGYLDKILIGFYSFTRNSGNLLELDKFYLHPSYIGKGYGRQLWSACCETAREMGENEFIVWSDFHAEAFYLKVGCIKIGKRQSPIRPELYPPLLKYIIP